MVEWYQNRLCIYGGWLYGEGEIMSFSNYRSLTGRKHLQVIRKACRNTPALVDYESMPDRFKKEIINRVGNVYQLAKENQLLKHIHHDPKAEKFYKDHKFGDNNNRSLPEEAQLEYYNDAIVMNAVHIVFTDRKARRRALGGTTKDIWKDLSNAVNSLDKTRYKHSLPSSASRLKEKHKVYMKESYKTFIHGGYCNKNTEKLNDEVKLWLLSQWANNIERITSVEHLLEVYNEYAANQRKSETKVNSIWKEIKSASTLQNFLLSEGIKPLWWPYRYGELKAKEKFMFQFSTKLPSMRDSLWYSDGTKLNYYYQDENGKVCTISVYEIMDTYSEVFLGYAICKNEDFKAQHSAYKMALEFSGYKPYQIVYDNQGGHKKLEATKFFEKLARVAIKTEPYNGKSKTIESAFGMLQKKFLKRDWFFTGQNITASDKESRANKEFILANKENLPTLEQVKDIYLKRRNEWNNAKHPVTNKPRIEMYRESINSTTVKLGLLDMVEIFCITHPNKVKVSAYGIGFKESKKKYNYMVYREDLPDVQWLSDHVDKKYVVKYDPSDMSKIYLYEDTNRGLSYAGSADEKTIIHRGIQEQEDWEAQYIRDIEKLKREVRIKNRDRMDEILKDNNLLPEQHGLNSPPLKGIETSIASRKAPEVIKRKAKKERTKGIAEIQKEISNAVALGNEDEINKLLDKVNDQHPLEKESVSIYDRM